MNSVFVAASSPPVTGVAASNTLLVVLYIVLSLAGICGTGGILGYVAWFLSRRRQRSDEIRRQAVRDNNIDETVGLVLPNKQGEGGLVQHFKDSRLAHENFDSRLREIEGKKGGT